MIKSLWSKFKAMRTHSGAIERARSTVRKYDRAQDTVRRLNDQPAEASKAVLEAHKRFKVYAKLERMKRIGVKELWRYGADVGGLMRNGLETTYDVLMAASGGLAIQGVSASDIRLQERTGVSAGTAKAAIRAIGKLIEELESETRVRINPDKISEVELALLESVARYVNVRRNLPAAAEKLEGKTAKLTPGLEWIKSQIGSAEMRYDGAKQAQLTAYVETFEPHIEKLEDACEVERRLLNWLPTDGPDSAAKRFSNNSAWFYAALESIIPPPLPGPAHRTNASGARPQDSGRQSQNESRPDTWAEREEDLGIPSAPRVRRRRADEATPTPAAPPRPPTAEVDPFEQIQFEPLPESSSDADHGHVPLEVAAAVESLELQRGKLTADLRRYQLFGAQFIVQQQRTLLGDDMGLGKTVQALAAMCHLDANGMRHFLVVVPNSVLINWEREVSTHTRLEPIILHGPNRFPRARRWQETGGVAITTYDSLGSLLPYVIKLDMLTVDEAHKVKNPAAKRTSLVKIVAERASHVALMSGTALENRLSELYNLVCLARPGIRSSANYLLSADRPSPEEARRRIATAYLRRTQDDVLSELPEMTKVDELVTLTQVELDSDEARKTHIQNQRIAATIGTGDGESSKYDRLEELLEFYRSNHDKVVIFSAFRKVLDDVSFICGGCEQITGDVSSQQRQSMIDRFRAKEGFACLALQVDAGGQGINLQFARVAILMEPQYKPSTENQAIARLQRMGQSRNVMVHRLIARDSIDEDLVELIKRKQQIFDDYAHQSAVKDESGMAIDSSTVQKELEDELQRRADERQRRRTQAG